MNLKQYANSIAVSMLGVVMVMNANAQKHSSEGSENYNGLNVAKYAANAAMSATERDSLIKEICDNMIFVKGGMNMMGATPNHGKNVEPDEKPVHVVKLSDFYIGKTEVTQAQWMAVMGKNPSPIKGDSLPVENVDWYDCQKFVEKLNSMTGGSFRLPTEAEWEYAACGAAKGRNFKYSGSRNLDDVAWYFDNSSSGAHPVATKAPNELGLYDMSGNVYEWCSDIYGKYSLKSQTNPQGAKKGKDRVFRGGCWRSVANYCRVTVRYHLYPEYKFMMGLRLACSNKIK